jgi:hypothetical protein
MRKQDRIAREHQQQQQGRPQEPSRKAQPPEPRGKEQVKDIPLPNRPPRQGGKLPLPD